VSDFEKALPIILEEEGGWYDGSQPWDPNPTMHGITQKRYDIYCDQQVKIRATVRIINDAEVHDIYLADYWVPSHAGQLSWPFSLLHFDFAVNAGPPEAIKVLQRFLRIADDGVWGPVTTAAVLSQQRLAADLLLERLFAYEDIVKAHPVKATPLVHEWIPRVKNLYRRFA
jgi:lysozyme family protein